MSFIKKLQYMGEYAALRTAATMLDLLPAPLFYGFTRAMGLFAYHVLRIRRQVAQDNIRQAYQGKLAEHEVKRICQEAYCNIGETFFETLIFSRLHKAINTLLSPADRQLIKKNLARGKGLILVSGHLGNWELLGASLAAAGIPVTGVGARQSNPHVDAYIHKSRTQMGFTVIRPDASTKHLIKALRNHGVIGLISDQNGGENGVFVQFFHRSASTPQGAAQLALRYGAPIMVMATIRRTSGSFKNILCEVAIHDHDTIESITQRYTTVLEEIIRHYPEQYFWMHRRWKTRPPAERQ